MRVVSRVLLLQIFNPFYVFQIFSVTWWCLDNYYIYACCIIVISLVSLGVELYETRKVRYSVCLFYSDVLYLKYCGNGTVSLLLRCIVLEVL